jgi:hypothetical protein
MQVDVTSDRNVSKRRFFKLSHRLYCENTAVVHFVARFFLVSAFQVSSYRQFAFNGRPSPNPESLSKRQQIKGHKHQTF